MRIFFIENKLFLQHQQDLRSKEFGSYYSGQKNELHEYGEDVALVQL